MIRVYHYNPADESGGWLPDGKLPDRLDDSVWWFDLCDPTEEEELAVCGRLLPVHPLTLEDMTRHRRLPDEPPHLPKVEEFRGYLFAVINPLAAPLGEGVPRVSQLSAVLTRTVLITHHQRPLPSVEQAKDFVTRHPETAERGPDYVFHLILDAAVDEYAPLVDGVADRLDELEDDVFRRPGRQLTAELLSLKRRVARMRKTLVLEREVLFRLSRGEFQLIDDREAAYYRNVYDHLVRYTELIENAREMVSDLMQSHLAASSNRLNEVMKVLTMISTAVLPMTLIAGVYGMNFKKWFPELEWEYGYLWALGLMAATGISSVTFFKVKGWL